MKLHKGSIAPEFTATDIEGKEISLSGLRQDDSVVLVFLRGFS